MAIKVLDIEGDVLLGDAGRASQDFLMINQPAFAFANVKDYLRLTRIIRKHNDDASSFFAPLQPPPEVPPEAPETCLQLRRFPSFTPSTTRSTAFAAARSIS